MVTLRAPRLTAALFLILTWVFPLAGLAYFVAPKVSSWVEGHGWSSQAGSQSPVARPLRLGGRAGGRAEGGLRSEVMLGQLLASLAGKRGLEGSMEATVGAQHVLGLPSRCPGAPA